MRPSRTSSTSSSHAQVHRYRHMKPGRVLLHGTLHRCASSLPLCTTSSCERAQPTPRGADAQRMLRNTHILVSGLKGTAVEFCKNIVLAGVGSVTLNDDRIVTGELLSANFLIPPDQNIYSGKSLAELCSDSLKDFNPMVRVSVEKAFSLRMNRKQKVMGRNFLMEISNQLFLSGSLPTKANKKTRIRAYDILVLIGHACGDEEKGGKKENLLQYFYMVAGGLAGETPHKISVVSPRRKEYSS